MCEGFVTDEAGRGGIEEFGQRFFQETRNLFEGSYVK